MSSISTTTTFGAFLGAVGSKRAGAFAFRASSSVMAGYVGSASGRTDRSTPPDADADGGADEDEDDWLPGDGEHAAVSAAARMAEDTHDLFMVAPTMQ
jgi:hypothetical protein